MYNNILFCVKLNIAYELFMAFWKLAVQLSSTWGTIEYILSKDVMSQY